MMQRAALRFIVEAELYLSYLHGGPLTVIGLRAQPPRDRRICPYAMSFQRCLIPKERWQKAQAALGIPFIAWLQICEILARAL
jgi:hypothetical protein